MTTPTLWLAEAELPRLCADAPSRDWLLERGSLTARLRDHWGDVAVRLLDEGQTVPLPHEAQRLGITPDTTTWVRCVLLVCQGRPRVYARTVIPNWGPHNPWAGVQRLGQQPLGELLFRRPGLQRSGFEWGPAQNWPHAGQWQAAGSSDALARRCVFARAQAPLLTEVFLALAPAHAGAERLPGGQNA